MSKKPFEVLGIQQIAIGGADKKRLRTLWIDVLGLSYHANYKNKYENVDEDILKIGSGPFMVEVDLMQPLDPDKKPRVDNPALNHVGLWVDDLDSAVNWMTERGVRIAPGGIRKGASGFEVCFIHPKSNDDFPISGEGVLFELVQAPIEVIEAKKKLEM